VHSTIGDVLAERESYKDAIAQYQKAVAICTRMQQWVSVARLHEKIGDAYQKSGDHAPAIDAFVAAETAYLDANERRNAAFVYAKMGGLLQVLKRRKEAISSFYKAQELFQELKDVARMDEMKRKIDELL
jgi:tetratricopeptide (TPR) repeat protein